MRVDELERLCRSRRIRAVYVTPHHQFPTTVLMKPERRLRLTALAEQFGFAIVEDDYDHEFHFVHRPMLPLASADRWGKVVYIGSMSKLLTPSVRIGYMAAPAPVIERAAAEIMIVDRQGDPAMETAVAELMESGAIKRHTRRVLRIYAERRELLGELLQARFGDLVSFTPPDGGLALWVQFNDGVDLAALSQRAAEHGVRFLPGRAFSVSGQEVRAVRLGFGSLDSAELKEAVRRFGRLVGEERDP
jgi:GntR family transcriptional regulator/MocR family aminotransferase